MHIFIDESGTFLPKTDGSSSVSAVGGLIIPSRKMKDFEKLYGRLRRKLPRQKGEVKGRLLAESDVVKLVAILRTVGALFEIVVLDMSLHNDGDVANHKSLQEEAITANLTDAHQESLKEDVWKMRHQLEKTSHQLYVQSVAMGELVYQLLNHGNMYHSLRDGTELGEYHWIIDAKDRSKVTPWEAWWSLAVRALLQSHTMREPMGMIPGGDYSAHDRLLTVPSDYIRKFAKNPERGEFLDLKPVLTDDFRFSSDAEFGLEAVDVLVNAVRRSLSGNFQRNGWSSIPSIMINRNPNTIRFIALSNAEHDTSKLPYVSVFRDFEHGGRHLLTKRVEEWLDAEDEEVEVANFVKVKRQVKR